MIVNSEERSHETTLTDLHRGEIILLHGSLADRRAWNSVVKCLKDDEDVQTPDLPGWGAAPSLPATGEQSTNAIAMALDKLIEAKSGQVLLAGHSYGGNVALHIALRNREKIRGLLLFEPVFFRALDLVGRNEILTGVTGFMNSYIKCVSAGNSEAVSEAIDYLLGEGMYEKLPETVQNFLVDAATKNVTNVRAPISEDVTNRQLADLDCPTMVVQGGASPMPLKETSAGLVQLLPHAELVSIPGANHGMLASHAAEVARMIEDMRAR